MKRGGEGKGTGGERARLHARLPVWGTLPDNSDLNTGITQYRQQNTGIVHTRRHSAHRNVDIAQSGIAITTTTTKPLQASEEPEGPGCPHTISAVTLYSGGRAPQHWYLPSTEYWESYNTGSGTGTQRTAHSAQRKTAFCRYSAPNTIQSSAQFRQCPCIYQEEGKDCNPSKCSAPPSPLYTAKLNNHDVHQFVATRGKGKLPSGGD